MLERSTWSVMNWSWTITEPENGSDGWTRHVLKWFFSVSGGVAGDQTFSLYVGTRSRSDSVASRVCTPNWSMVAGSSKAGFWARCRRHVVQHRVVDRLAVLARGRQEVQRDELVHDFGQRIELSAT